MAERQPTHPAANWTTCPECSAPTGNGPHTCKPRASIGLAIGAAVIITSITGIAFWLSYYHLHDVAAGHGLAVDPARAWAWPAVLDLFYLAGELLILRASFLRTVDYWAIALTALGAVGSIGLNVAGVGTDAAVLDYVVAAVPPIAALLAFGALMGQVHRSFVRIPAAVIPPMPVAPPVIARVTVEPTPVSAPPVVEQPAGIPGGFQAPELPAGYAPADEPLTAALAPELTPARAPYDDPRVEAIRKLYDTGLRPTSMEMAKAVEDAGYPRPAPSSVRTLRQIIEAVEPHLAPVPFPRRTG
jgi:hypothetical protein